MGHLENIKLSAIIILNKIWQRVYYEKNDYTFGDAFITLWLFYVYFNSNTASPPEHLKAMTKEQMIEDYDIFWNTLENYHTSLDALDSAEVNHVKAKYALKIQQMTGNNAQQYLSYYLQTINELHGIGHLQIVTENLFKELEIISTAEYSNFPNYDRLLSDRKVRATARWIDDLYGSPGISTSGNTEAEFEHIDNEISYIKIPSFSNTVMDEQGPLVADWIEHHLDDKAMIIDIRGNGGGNGAFWYDYILPYIIEEDIYLTNYFFIKAWPIEPDCSSIGKRFDAERKASKEEIEYVCSLPLFNAEILDHSVLYKQTAGYSSGDKTELYKGNIYLLIDEETGSAATDMAIFFKRTGIGAVIGQARQYGSGSSTGLSPVWFSLPNSGISFMFQLQCNINDDGSCGQASAFQPDYYAENDALELCLDKIH